MYLNIVLIMLKTLTIFIRVLLCESAFRVLVPVAYASALGVFRALDLIPTVLNLIRMWWRAESLSITIGIKLEFQVIHLY